MVRSPSQRAVPTVHARGGGRRTAAGGLRNGRPGGLLTRAIALLGLRCAGKTTVGRVLAERLGADFLDTDVLLAAMHGSGAPVSGPKPASGVAPGAGEMLQLVGEPAFRRLEEQALAGALRPAVVVATGGGCVEWPDSRRLLTERAVCVWLEADVPVLAQRMSDDPTLRPALVGGDCRAELSVLAARRAPFFAELAAFSIDTNRDDAASLAEQIERELRRKGLH